MPRTSGAGLQDHIAAGASWHTPLPITMVGADKSVKHIANYLVRHRGPFSSVVAEAGGFVRTDASLAAPDIQLLFAPAMFLDHGFTDPPGHGIALAPYLLTPRVEAASRCTRRIRRRSRAIRANYYAERSDLDRMLAGLRLCFDIAAQPALAPYVGERFLPAPGDDSDEALTAFLRAKSETIYHPTVPPRWVPPMTTCATRSCGARRRRVARGRCVGDADRHPGNTNAPVIMIAEKAVDLIRQNSPRPSVLSTA